MSCAVKSQWRLAAAAQVDCASLCPVVTYGAKRDDVAVALTLVEPLSARTATGVVLMAAVGGQAKHIGHDQLPLSSMWSDL